jgi:hypothetical protein
MSYLRYLSLFAYGDVETYLNSNNTILTILYFYRTRIVCHWIIYGYTPMIRSFVYRAFVRLRFPYNSLTDITKLK